MAKKKKKSADPSLFAENRKARSRFEILDTWEAGIVLRGAEVKVTRGRQVSLVEAWVSLERGELWLKGAHFPRYRFDASAEHDPTRPRKLLLHRQEILFLAGKVAEKGLALVPLALKEVRGKVKVIVGLAKGLAGHDKRRQLREKAEKEKVLRAVKNF
jgi:SsrA-binding protein